MQPHVLTLIALLAPLPAAAFGDLDCISFESCGNGGCGPVTDVFAVTFDWAAEEATVEIDDSETTLPLMTQGESHDTTMRSMLEYGDLGGNQNRLLRIETQGDSITAYWSFKDPMVSTLVAQCDVRKDA